MHHDSREGPGPSLGCPMPCQWDGQLWTGRHRESDICEVVLQSMGLKSGRASLFSFFLDGMPKRLFHLVD